MTTTVAPDPSGAITDVDKRTIWSVIGASSVGTVIEWYDFFIFGSLAAVLAPKFFPEGNDTLALIAYLSTFAVGFLVRPFGALFFGRLGDRVGRKHAFLITLLIMGLGTSAIGAMPTYETIGVAAPIILLVIRVLQGLSIGGEYGGAATYVAEHVPDGKRGFYTSFIQITATLGLFVSLGVVVGTQTLIGQEAFESWGWRLPFLLSILLVATSLLMRMRMNESPIFEEVKSSGKSSPHPIKDAFATRVNRRRMAISLFGATAGQAVVWYTGQFYALFFLQKVLAVESRLANVIVLVALMLGMPLFVVFAALSDRIGRKRLMIWGCALAAVSYLPIYKLMQIAAGNNVVGVGSEINPVTSEIKLLPQTLVDGQKVFLEGTAANPNVVALIGLVFIQVVFATMVYGPIAAYLVEAFPARVRYTSMSLPYHIGNGVFGGLLPVIGLSLCAATGSIYAGLAYPIAIALITVVVGWRYLPETMHVRIWDELHGDAPADHPTRRRVPRELVVTAAAAD